MRSRPAPSFKVLSRDRFRRFPASMLSLRKLSSPLLVAVLVLAGCRQDMHDQPRFKPLAKSDFYADMRSAREPVEGTVARGQLHEETYFYTGKVGNLYGE